MSLLILLLQVQQGAALWRRGDTADRACLLLRGKLEAVIGGGDSHQQRRVIQSIMPGNFAGELGLLCVQAYTHTNYIVFSSVVCAHVSCQ
jgi:CRP-like cAMP-binding protein